MSEGEEWFAFNQKSLIDVQFLCYVMITAPLLPPGILGLRHHAAVRHASIFRLRLCEDWNHAQLSTSKSRHTLEINRSRTQESYFCLFFFTLPNCFHPGLNQDESWTCPVCTGDKHRGYSFLITVIQISSSSLLYQRSLDSYRHSMVNQLRTIAHDPHGLFSSPGTNREG